MSKEYETAQIRKMVKATFNDDEFQEFCFDNFYHVYENFSNGMGRSVKILLLLEYCKRHGKYDQLLEKIREFNPYQFNIFNTSSAEDASHSQWQKTSSHNHESVVEIVTACDTDLSDLTPAQREGLIVGIRETLASVLNIPSSEVKVMEIRSGSIVLDISLPAEMVEQLMALGDDFLREELGIQKLSLKKIGKKTTLSHESIWQATLGQLKLQMTKATFNTWLKDARLLACEENEFVVGVRNDYAKDWLENRLRDTILRTLSAIIDHPVNVRFVVWSDELITPASPVMGSQGKQEKSTRLEHAQSGTAEYSVPNESVSIQGLTFNQRFTFSTFIVGQSNRLAHAAALSVSENPGQTYNPLFIYGGVGLGKTHLLHAIGQKCVSEGLTVTYISSETFTNDLVQSIRNKQMSQFRERYRTPDVLLIDDIQFIAGKESTQEELFHTFNDLHSRGKQVVLSSDRTPKAMATLEERLQSRFEWGLMADIQLPDTETRKAILQAKAEDHGIEVPDHVIDLIAHHVRNNIRELEGALNKVIAYAQLSGTNTVDSLLVNMALADMVRRPEKVTIDQVIQTVCLYYNVTVDSLSSTSRNRSIAFPRQMVMYLARTEAGASLPQIGTQLGNRDHTIILDGYEKIASALEKDSTTRRVLLEIKAALYRDADAIDLKKLPPMPSNT